jgi:hypothetical protein
LRTVKEELMPRLERAMHRPSKAWIRERSPSFTCTFTRSVSPGAKAGMVLASVSFAICSASSVWMMFMVRVLLETGV